MCVPARKIKKQNENPLCGEPPRSLINCFADAVNKIMYDKHLVSRNEQLNKN